MPPTPARAHPAPRSLLRGRRGAIFVAVGLLAGALAIALVIASQVGSGGGSKAPVTRATGAAETAALFRGVPQSANVLGKPSAPYTFFEFADLQCPFCRDFATDALPTLVRDYVRSGQVKVVFSGMHFIGPDSEKALRAVYAAGLQNRSWQFLDLLYRNQGAENRGWVTDALLRSIGAAIPGFDTKKLLADMDSGAVTQAIAVSDQRASEAAVSSTPTFFAGKTGGTLQQLALAQLTGPALKQALAPIVG